MRARLTPDVLDAHAGTQAGTQAKQDKTNEKRDEIVPYTLVPYSLYSVHDIVHYIGNREREFGHYAEHF